MRTERVKIKINPFRKLGESLNALEDKIGDRIVRAIRRIPAMDERAKVIEKNPNENPFKKIRFQKTAIFFGKINNAAKNSWNRTLGDRIKKRQEEKLNSLLENPQKNRNEVKKEIRLAFSNATGRGNLAEIALVAKRIIQYPGLAADHLPIPLPKTILPLTPFTIPFVTQVFERLADITTWPIFSEYAKSFSSGTPIFLSSAIIAAVFNIPNAIQAFAERRHKKAAYELAILTPLSIVVPFGIIDNSFWQETAIFGPQERRRGRRFISQLDKMVSDSANNTQAKQEYEQIFSELIVRKYGRKNETIEDAFRRAAPKLMQKEIDTKKDIKRNTRGMINQKIILDFIKYLNNLGQTKNRKLPLFLRFTFKPAVWLATLVPKLFVHAGLALSEGDTKENEHKLETLEIIKKLVNIKSNGG